MTRVRYIVALSSALLLTALLAGCGGDDDAAGTGEDQISIVTSTSIVAALAEEVAGEHADITTLMEPGVDPHTFETSPGDVRRIAGADLVLINGLGLDDFLIDDVQAASGDIPIVVITDGIEFLEAGEDDHAEHDEDSHEEDRDHEEGDGHDYEDDDGHDHGAIDPHVWQDPLRAKAMVDNIADALAEHDPERAEEYRGSAEAYQQTLDETHAEIQALVDEIPAERRKLVTNHEAFGYFANRYGFEVVGTVIPGLSSEADPSAGEIADLTDLIQHAGVDVIFTEALLDSQVADRLAEDAGIEVVHGLYSDQIGEPGSGVGTLHEMLLANARMISDALR